MPLAGCAFDVVHLKRLPAQYETVPPTAQSWVLQDDVKVSLASGWSTKLKKGTTWRQVGRLQQGDVMATRDQIVTVEASNVHEASPVIAREQLVGFFLVVEQTFTPADPPLPINLQKKTETPEAK